MEQSSFSATSRQNADKNLLTILLAGVGGSLAFHVAAIAGVATLWKPVAPIDEPMEITMVDVDSEKPPQPKVIPIVKAPTKVEPKPVPIVKVPAKLEPKIAPAKPMPIVKVPAQVTQKPVPIVKTASSLDNFIDSAKPTLRERVASKPAPRSIEPPLKAVAPPAFPDEIFKPAPVKTSAVPTQKIAKSPTFTTPQPEQPKIVTEPQPETPIRENQSGLASNSPNRQLATRSTDTPAPTQEQDFEQVTPSKVNAPTEEIASSNHNQSGLTSNPATTSKLAGKLAANNTSPTTDDNFGEVAPSKIKTPTTDEFAGSSNNQSGLAGKPTSGGKLVTRLAGNTPSSNHASDGDPGGVERGNSWRGARAEPGAGLKPNPGNSGGDDAGSGKTFGLQCIKRCDISGLTDLEDRDGGKDKLRIKIAVDPNGNVTRASIAKSSGNSTIDRVVINGVKQMQFSPPGKIVERVVKANILL
ncbi:TonB family protein [Chamaesiphon sp. VAR_48_metabat_135_sub]|uniref:TonB family protein n=1 Tax=Chamaesiphon sp. VAR_48_metabat_135_sub TaxID=2964699 RepID=UPI00286C0A26|nr:TonB family protein [Chamaesiphon sp. VAR_48_metabat_135_sub]